MGTGIQFDLRLKDMMSGALPKVERAARSAFGGVSSAADKAQKAMDGIGRSSRKAQSDMSTMGNAAVKQLNDVGSAADKAASRIERMGRMGQSGGGSNGGGGFWKMAGAMGIGSLAGGLVSKGIGMVAGQGKDILTSGLEASRNRAQFDVLGRGEGGKLYEDLTKYIKDSIFGNEQYDFAKQLLSYGVKPKDVMGDLKMLGNIAGGDAEKMRLLNYAWAQTTSVGKLQGNDLMQYTGAGFNPLQVISEHTGKSMAQLMKDKEEGKITADMVRQAMMWDTTGSGLHAGMLDKMGATPFGKQDAMAGNFKVAMQEFGEKLLPSYGRLLDSMKPVIDRLPSAMDSLVPAINGAIDAFGTLLPSLIEFGHGMGKLLGPVFGALTSPEFVGALKGVLELGSSLATTLGPLVKEVAGDFKILMDTVRGVTGVIKCIVDFGNSHGLGDAVKTVPNTMTGNALPILGWVNDKLGWNKHPEAAGPKAAAAVPDVKAPAKMPPMDAKAAAAAQETSDSIIGGGKRAIYINFKNFVETINNNGVGSSGEAIAMNAAQLKGPLLELLAELPG